LEVVGEHALRKKFRISAGLHEYINTVSALIRGCD
jgi:hypothetical protein